jgi:hypothetical protein
MSNHPSKKTTPVILGICALAAALTVSSPARGQQDRYPWRDMQQHAFDVAEGGSLRVRVDDADVAVVATDGVAAVTLRLRSNDMDWAVDRFERTGYRARVDGDTIVVESDEEPRGSWISGNWMSVFVEVHVPTRFDLDVVTQDGDVSVGSFEGEAILRTQDGDITIDALDGDSIDLSTQDGDLRAAMLAGRTVQVRSQDGDIEVEALRGAVSMYTQDGDIIIGTADAPELELGSHDGDIHVAISEDARMELETQDGDISIDAPSSLRADIDFSGEEVYIRGGFDLQGSVSEHHARGSINGGGERIRARAGDGSVRLLFREAR